MDRWLLLGINVVLLLLVAGVLWLSHRWGARRRGDGGARAPDDRGRSDRSVAGLLRDGAGDGNSPSLSGADGAGANAADSAPGSSGAQTLIVLTRPSATRHPIVLAHGYFGFERIGPTQMGREYFRGVRRKLEALGYSVYVTRVSPAAGIEVRAAQLAAQIRRMGAQRVNIIAHSMGGLDARLAISKLGLATHVASLTTIGTPHHGTPLADMALCLGDWSRVRRMLDSMGMNVDGLYDVSTARMLHFNRKIVDAPDVSYASVVGAVGAASSRSVNALLFPGHAFLSRRVGANDGVVPATSQRWGRSLAEVEADHWAQIGWFANFDVESFYVRLAEDLAARDF